MTGPRVRVAAQAKLNLHLRVLSREQSGFHSIETLFHRIDLADEIIVEAMPAERTLDVVGPGTGTGTGPTESNLAFRAAVAYAERAGWPSGFRIELTKRIPIGAGLGGGSSDAAAVLRALNSLSPQPIPQTAILEIAAGLGSDVTFLASDAVMALAWGRGERMLKCAPLPRNDVLLMTPEFSVSTADAYRWLDDDRASRGNAIEAPMLLESMDLTTWAAIARFACNDFEDPVAARHPALADFLQRLRSSRALFAQMTGSGSTFFGVFDTPPHFAKVPEEHRARVTTTMTSIDVVQPVRVG